MSKQALDKHTNTTISYKPQITSVTDYYAIGSQINERTYDPVKPLYRFGFNTQEKTFELNRDHYTAKFWEYDSRLGRRWNVDPEPTYGWSNYSVLFDNPIKNVDILGNKPLDDYYISQKGSIRTVKTDEKKDKFYIEDEKGKYKLLAELEKNDKGLVNFPDKGIGFERYGIIDKGGTSINPNENVGKGDHWLMPETAAALFGLTYYLNKQYGFTISLGDMSSSSGSDPWTAGSIHHKGHGHLGKRSGLDVDFRYLDKNGISFQDKNAFESANFDKLNNQILYNTAYKFGFTKNYQGTSGNLLNVKKVTGHNDHGHLGLDYNNLDWKYIPKAPTK